jgi:DNA-binding Xre family transcriptional regulator
MSRGKCINVLLANKGNSRYNFTVKGGLMIGQMSRVRLRLLEILKDKNISQVKLSEMTGLSKNAISKLIGSPRQIRLDTIDSLCRALSIEPGDLFLREIDNREN